MPTYERISIEEGDVPSSGDLNAPYIALGAGSIDESNVAAGAIAYHHIGKSGEANTLYGYQNPTGVGGRYDSETYTIVSDGTTNASLALGITPETNEVLRLQASGLVTNVDPEDTYDNVGSDKGKWNYYAFKLVLTYNDGGASSTVDLGRWGYSFNVNSLDTYAGNHPAPARTPDIQNQTFQFSTMYRCAVPNREYEKVELFVAVNHNPNELTISRHQIQVVRHQR